MVDVFTHSARLDTAAVEERRDLVQVVPDSGKLPCDGFDLVRVDIEHIRGIHAAFHQWCCTIKVDIGNSKSQYIEKDKQEATKDGSESTEIRHGI